MSEKEHKELFSITLPEGEKLHGQAKDLIISIIKQCDCFDFYKSYDDDEITFTFYSEVEG